MKPSEASYIKPGEFVVTDEARHQAHMSTLLRIIDQNAEVLRMNARIVAMLTCYGITVKIDTEGAAK